MITIYLAGEGQNELGSYAREQCYRPECASDVECGVIEACLRKIQTNGWTIVDAMCWKDLLKSKSAPKLRPGRPVEAETRAVETLAVRASDAQAQVLIFIRDRDDEKERVEHINEGIELVRSKFPSICIAGACAISCIEAWMLAFQGVTKSESLGKSAAQTRLGFDKDTQKMVDLVDNTSLTKIPPDAKSLQDWLVELRHHFA